MFNVIKMKRKGKIFLINEILLFYTQLEYLVNMSEHNELYLGLHKALSENGGKERYFLNINFKFL